MPLEKVLVTQYYISPHEERRKEIDFVLTRNASNHRIDRIGLFCEEPFVERAKELCGNHLSKVSIIVQKPNKRTTFGETFDWAKDNIADGSVVMFANSDILFDHSLDDVDAYLTREVKTALLLCRWEFYTFTDCRLHASYGSHDTWMFRMPLTLDQSTLDAAQTIPYGQPGCDNRMAHEICNVSKYDGINACYRIRTFHVHASNIRAWDPKNPQDVVPPPYHYPRIE